MSPGKTRSAKYRHDQQLKFDTLLVEDFYAAANDGDTATNDGRFRRPPAKIVTGGSRMVDYDREGVMGDLIAETIRDYDPAVETDYFEEITPTASSFALPDDLESSLPDPVESNHPTLIITQPERIEDTEESESDPAHPASLRMFAAAIGCGLAAALLILVGIALTQGM